LTAAHHVDEERSANRIKPLSDRSQTHAPPIQFVEGPDLIMVAEKT
jgi:hypothetical protein